MSNRDLKYYKENTPDLFCFVFSEDERGNERKGDGDHEAKRRRKCSPAALGSLGTAARGGQTAAQGASGVILGALFHTFVVAGLGVDCVLSHDVISLLKLCSYFAGRKGELCGDKEDRT